MSLLKEEFAPKHRQRDIGQHRFLRVILRVPIAITFAHSDRVLRFVFHFVVNLVAETVGGYRRTFAFLYLRFRSMEPVDIIT